jgi:hypothetical protein
VERREDMSARIVRHYQGDYYQIIVDSAKHTDEERNENVVVYQNTHGELFALPSWEFWTNVEVDGQIIPRFEVVAVFPNPRLDT